MSTTLGDLDWPFRTDRLVLRRARSEDADAIWDWYQRPDVHEWTSGRPHSLEYHRQRWEEGLPWRIVGERSPHGGAGAGTCGEIAATGLITTLDPWGQEAVRSRTRHTMAELGWVMHPDHSGQGLGTEFARELLCIAIAEMGLRRVTALCFAENRASWRIMEKIGMRCEGTHRADSLHVTRGWVDSMTWAVLAEEWHAQQAGPDTPRQDPTQ
ncbi:GNAT family N-acetyltransferase [Brachybacterium endophyticum]|uniref:GNAT family N-acetyltransferase n=1 Tax=Brachybacterium endophyticum TaxID=2182385 RepID=A0A2U2RHZ8_9MICO|nr:GNAT family protein [Brachybacterium endophyticum]PWH05497.1 GNAT family N-acetyltransferase [Brachybacterium endophyticum]